MKTALCVGKFARHSARRRTVPEPSGLPLWDGSESVADYAKRVNLPPTKTLELGNGVNLELVLIPAGRFVMGTPEPTPADEEGFNKKIVVGQEYGQLWCKVSVAPTLQHTSIVSTFVCRWTGTILEAKAASHFGNRIEMMALHPFFQTGPDLAQIFRPVF